MSAGALPALSGGDLYEAMSNVIARFGPVDRETAARALNEVHAAFGHLLSRLAEPTPDDALMSMCGMAGLTALHAYFNPEAAGD